MADEDRDSFIRWQEVTRSHFGAVSNLVLALATGLLAYHSTLLLDRKLSASCAFGFAVTSLFLLAISIALALWCSVNRLRDFRLTARIARCRQKGETELHDLREESELLGKFTWRLFWFQLTSFGLGAGCGALAIVIQLWSAVPTTSRAI